MGTPTIRNDQNEILSFASIYWPHLVYVCANGTISAARSDITEQLTETECCVNVQHLVNREATDPLITSAL